MHKSLAVALCAAFNTSPANAVEFLRSGSEERTDQEAATDVPETVVTASGAPRPALEAPQSISVIDSAELARRSYRTLPQALRYTPGVLVQETSHGQGSPYIRGFTAFRDVFLIDGVRLNNSVFREGPNQYWATIDPWSLDRIEVLRGPSSVLYGSDAIGGTVQAFTKMPYADGAPSGLVALRGATAENSLVGRVEGSAGGGGLGLLVGATFKDFGDVEGGRDIGDQPNTGYDEYDVDAKAEQFLDADTRLVIGYQHVRQNDVPRTHSTNQAVSFEGTSVGSDVRRDLDQERDLVYAQFFSESGEGPFDSWSAGLSLHRQAEEEDRVRSSLARSLNGFDVTTIGAFAHFESTNSAGTWSYGVDVQHDEVDSFSTGSTIQGPVADDSTYDLVGAFLQNELDATDRLKLTLGARAEWAAVDADRVEDPVSSTQFAIEDDWASIVGSARFHYELDGEELGLFGGVSQGFRAPNLSDLTRFDSARSNEFEIPSPGLDPEHYLTFELGARAANERASGELAVFYTDIDDMIVRFPTGNTNGSGDFEITKDNIGDGWIYGVELSGAFELADDFTLFGNATFMEGKVSTYPTSAPVLTDEWIDRLMPFTAQLGLRWDDPGDRGFAEFQAVFAADADRLSTRDAGDTQRIPPGGTPGYLVLNARTGWTVAEGTDVLLAVENVTDEDYRIHGSGTNQPGLNVLVGVSFSF
ncbi:MAG: TonB-dependent receptor [Planctomycetota bacterium]